jgi:hypothetical protein
MLGRGMHSCLLSAALSEMSLRTRFETRFGWHSTNQSLQRDSFCSLYLWISNPGFLLSSVIGPLWVLTRRTFRTCLSGLLNWVGLNIAMRQYASHRARSLKFRSHYRQWLMANFELRYDTIVHMNLHWWQQQFRIILRITWSLETLSPQLFVCCSNGVVFGFCQKHLRMYR